MYVTNELNYQECWVLLHWISGHVCSIYNWPLCKYVLLSPDQLSMPQGQQTYLPLHMFDYVTLDQHTCLKPSSYVCNSFTRLSGILQYPYLKRCLEPTGMFDAVSPDNLARRLQFNLISMHVCYSCIYKQICLNLLQLTYRPICSIYVTLGSDPQLCP